jgi:heptosyltransferase-2
MGIINKILVIRFRRVGDAVLSTALCSSLKQSFPHATVDYVLNKNIAPLFENHPDIDNILFFSEGDMSTFWGYTRKVRRIMKTGNYDMIVDTRSTVKTFWFCLFSMKTPYRAGLKKAYNLFIQNYRNSNKNSSDIVDATLSLLRPLEKHFPIVYNRNFTVYPTEEEKIALSKYLCNQDIDLNKPVIICAVATRLPYKMWKQQHMKEILLRILDTYGNVQLVFNFAGKEEESVARELHSALNHHPRVFSEIEAKNLRELAAVISLSTFFFGNEGGPRHISQALDVPSFAIYPPNISKRMWLPGENERYQGIEPADVSRESANSKELSYEQKFDLITVDEVWKPLRRMLDKYLFHLA